MGWTSYYPTEYKNGRIDRKAEMDKEFHDWEDETAKRHIIKSTMVGSTYYAAMEITYKDNTPRKVIGVVCLTSVREGQLYYKDMTEACGPNEAECPNSILSLLTPTDNEYAVEWRKRCLEHFDLQRKLKDHTKTYKIEALEEIEYHHFTVKRGDRFDMDYNKLHRTWYFRFYSSYYGTIDLKTFKRYWKFV